MATDWAEFLKGFLNSLRLPPFFLPNMLDFLDLQLICRKLCNEHCRWELGGRSELLLQDVCTGRPSQPLPQCLEATKMDKGKEVGGGGTHIGCKSSGSVIFFLVVVMEKKDFLRGAIMALGLSCSDPDDSSPPDGSR